LKVYYVGEEEGEEEEEEEAPPLRNYVNIYHVTPCLLEIKVELFR
jgi:hypothetical protein